MFGFKFKKKQKRGSYRSAKQRAAEQKDLVDELLIKSWLQDLKDHPEYTRQVARQKFGMSDSGEDREMGAEPPSFIEQLQQVAEAKENMESIFGQAKQEGFLSQLPEIMKNMPQFAEGVRNLIASGAMQQLGSGQPQPPTQGQQPPMTAEQEQKMALQEFAHRFTALEPEEAAQELYENRDKVGDVRAIIWQVLTESEEIGVDEVVGMFPLLKNYPKYQFLKPFANKLTTTTGKQWLALLIDEVKRLNSPETASEPSEIAEDYGGIEEQQQ